MFDFFGFGQQGHQPLHGPNFQANNEVMPEVQVEQAAGWGLWPEEPQQQPQELDFDLNLPAEPAEDDPGLVKNLEGLANHQGFFPQDVQMEEDIIVPSSDSEGSAEEQHEVALVDEINQDVNVFIPMEDGIPLQLIADEIHVHELVDQMAEDELPEQPIFPVVNQLGFVELFEPAADPVFVKRMQQQSGGALTQNPAAIRLWANYLAPGPGTNPVLVPKPWADFFTFMLDSPTSFAWAKNLLSSQAWSYFLQPGVADSIPFSLPATYPDAAGHLFALV
jgi:hypothetical protein